MSKILAVLALVLVVGVPLLQASAALPTPAQLGNYVATTSDNAADYTTETIFTGNVFKVAIFLALLSSAIWFLIRGVRRMLG